MSADRPESLGSSAMEEDEDDLYGEPTGHGQQFTPSKTHDLNDDQEDYEPDEDDESDSDIEIVTERQPGDEEVTVQAAKSASQTIITPAGSQAVPIIPPTQAGRLSSPKADVSSRSQVTLQSGKSYPEVRTSTIDVNGNPVYPPVGKPITEIEADADLAEHEKPWRRPGADQTDYFNYGFDEFTWSTYCLRQKTMADALTEQKAENSQFERMFGGSGAAAMMPGMAMPAMPPGAAGGDMSGMSAMMGMPSMPDAQSMQQMMQQLMVEQGITDPSQLDFQQVMNRMQAGAGAMMGQPSIPSGPAAQQQSYGGANWQQGGYGRGGGGKQRGRW